MPGPTVPITRLPHGEGIPLPAYETAQAAGMDLRAAVPEDEPLVLHPGDRFPVPTGLAFALPPGFEGQVRPRSGLAFKNGITCLNSPGTVDADYRGEVKVILINHGPEAFTIRRGDRIAQLVIAPVVQATWTEVASLDDTARGAGGFGVDRGPMSLGLEAAGIRSRVVDGVNGLSMHLLEAGDAGRPVLLLLHGFPELAYSWRKVMPTLAAAGYHVIAPDQRGYGGTTGWADGYGVDLEPFTQVSLVRDAVALLDALGVARARAVIGHDYGSTVAAHAALIHPQRFGAVAMMSAPFAGAPPTAAIPPTPQTDIHAALAALSPPRKLYQWYYSTPQADGDMQTGDLHAFLRAYYHVKSADWAGNRLHALTAWRADQLALLPDYYVMPLGATMPQAVAPFMPTAPEIAACAWLPDAELAVYAEAFGRTGFQGGLNWYRCATTGLTARDLLGLAGRTIDIPAMFIGGAADWGVQQVPGAFEAMQTRACSRFVGAELIEGAGHWVQQEQPQAVSDALLRFLEP